MIHALEDASALFSPLQLGAMQLQHRVVMAPLTRMRAVTPDHAATPSTATYYRQRATRGGLLISEASQISQQGQGVPASPGIFTDAQAQAWRQVTDAVHDEGGAIVLQLWHVGRISHRSHQVDGALPVAPSALAASGMAMTADFSRAPLEAPRALRADELPGLIEDYRHAARQAQRAGFDGVEVHAANGYLLEQFMQSRSNQRDDAYGGSIENRCRLPLEVTRAVAEVWGADRVGIRLSPFGVANDSGEAEPMDLYGHMVTQLAPMGLAYLHLIEPRASGAGQKEVNHSDVPSACELFRPLWPGGLITAGNFTREGAVNTVTQGHADAIAFGRYFISNPDLPQRLARGLALTPYDRATFYGGGDAGYIDYPRAQQH